MHMIRTAEALSRLLHKPPDENIRPILDRLNDTYAEFGDEIADILILQAGDMLTDVERDYGQRLVAEGRFTFPVELIQQHTGWIEVLWVISDDGQGLVLMIQDDPRIDPELQSACQHALAEAYPL